MRVQRWCMHHHACMHHRCMQVLRLNNTAVRDLTPLAVLTNLRELHLRVTQADTAPLKHLEQLVIYQ